MLIDWFTVGAQALNFVVLIALLKRFLYRPVLDAVDAREARIDKQLAEAAADVAVASAEREAFRQRNETFDREREALLRQATDDAQSERQRLVDEARSAADALRARRQDALRREAAQLNRDIGELAQREVFAIARKVLADLASANLEARVAEVFAARLRALDGPARERLAAAFVPGAARAVVRSAFELAGPQRKAIDAALNDAIGERARAAIALEFEVAPEVLGGIELVAGGQKLAWSIAQYLGSLERAAAGLLDAEDGADPAVPVEAQASPAASSA